MGVITPAILTVSPSFMEPDIVTAYSQPSGAYMLLPNGKPRVKLSDGDLAVYLKRLDIRTRVGSGQAAYNMLPTVEPVFGYASTATYLTRVRAEFDHHDAAAASRWGAGIQQLYRLGMRQAHFNIMRSALLYGLSPAFGEGFVNTAGATSVSLPPDTNGDTTVSTYDNGQMAFFLLQQIQTVKTKTNQLGMKNTYTILTTQRILAQWEYSGIVQLVQYQRVGAGTETTAGVVKMILESHGDELIFVADDTLIGKGNGGSDMIIIVQPEVNIPDAPTEINTNAFAGITPGFKDTVAQYCDMVAPREITTPLAGGAVDILSEHRITAGWGVRPEAILLISAIWA